MLTYNHIYITYYKHHNIIKHTAYTLSYNLFKEPHSCESPRSDPVVAAILQRGSSKGLSSTISSQHHHLLDEKSALVTQNLK